MKSSLSDLVVPAIRCTTNGKHKRPEYKSCDSYKSPDSDPEICVNLSCNAVLVGLLPIFVYEFLEEK